jgi:hypothetical protein
MSLLGTRGFSPIDDADCELVEPTVASPAADGEHRVRDPMALCCAGCLRPRQPSAGNFAPMASHGRSDCQSYPAGRSCCASTPLRRRANRGIRYA